MATHIRIIRKDGRDLLFDRVFPDSVDPVHADKLVSAYIQLEGINTMYPLLKQTLKTADYTKFNLEKPVLWGAAREDTRAHIAWERDISFCGIKLVDAWVSSVKYRGACDDCLHRAAL